MPYYVKVPFETGGTLESRIIPVNVSSKESAIAQAKASNPGPGFLWDEAEVEEGD